MFNNIWTNIIEFASTVSINDIVDVIIVAYAIYKGIKIVRDTKAEQLLKGMGLLLIVMQLSSWLKLNTINFILTNMVQVGVIALLVVFQPELRNALEQLGRSNFSNIINFDTTENLDQIISVTDTICETVVDLSKRKIGALIVIEKESKLGDIAKTGIPLDSLVSTELLVNIFTPMTPLHDGAVLIRKNRIYAASCLLPLTQNNNLDSDLGTRHRAAIGMSENSDALVVVVSEESGYISIAFRGTLHRNISKTTLNRILKLNLIPETPENSRKRMNWLRFFEKSEKPEKVEKSEKSEKSVQTEKTKKPRKIKKNKSNSSEIKKPGEGDKL